VAHNDTRRPVAALQKGPASLGCLRHQFAMDPEARRRACVEFRDKLSRDTGVNLTAAACARVWIKV